MVIVTVGGDTQKSDHLRNSVVTAAEFRNA
jgi:hypothetical protein